MIQDNVIFIVGKRGFGKSTLSKSVLSQYRRIVIFDPLREYHGYTVVHSMDDFFDFFRDNPEEFCLVCRFYFVDASEQERQYEYAAKACKLLGNLLLVLEECELFITSSDRGSYINYLISMGRHFGVNLLAVGRRPSEIPIKFRANFTTVAAFNVTEPRDLQTMQAYGFDPDELKRLPKFHYLFTGKDIFPHGKDCKVTGEQMDNSLLLRESGECGNTSERNRMYPLQDEIQRKVGEERGNDSQDIL